MRMRHSPFRRMLYRPLASRSQLTISPAPATGWTAGLPAYAASYPGRSFTTASLRSRASVSITITRYRASNTWSGRSVCGKNVTSGSGKNGRTSVERDRDTDSGELRQRLERGQLVQARAHRQREVAKHLRLRRVRTPQGDRRALVAADPGLGIERDLGEQRDPVLVGESPAAPLTEDVVAPAGVRRHEVAHVLDDAEQRHVELLEHPDRLADVEQRDLLGRRHHDDAVERDDLRER